MREMIAAICNVQIQQQHKTILKSWENYTRRTSSVSTDNLDIVNTFKIAKNELEKAESMFVSEFIDISKKQYDKLLRNLKKIDIVDYSTQNFTDAKLNSLFNKLDSYEKVAIGTLDLSYTELSHKHITMLTDYLLQGYHGGGILSSFVMCQNLLFDGNQNLNDPETINVLAHFIEKYASLHEISFENCNLNAHAIAAIARAVNRRKNWVSIKVSPTPETDKAVALLNDMVTKRQTRAFLLGGIIPPAKYTPEVNAIDSFMHLDKPTLLKQGLEDLLKITHDLIDAFGPHECDPKWGSDINSKTELSRTELYAQHAIILQQALTPIEAKIQALSSTDAVARAKLVSDLGSVLISFIMYETPTPAEDNVFEVHSVSSQLLSFLQCAILWSLLIDVSTFDLLGQTPLPSQRNLDEVDRRANHFFQSSGVNYEAYAASGSTSKIHIPNCGIQ